MDIDTGLTLDALPAMVWTASPDGRLDFVSRRWTEYTGLRADEAHGRDWQAAVKPDDLPKLLERWRSILASGKPGEIEARVRRFDGQYRWFLVQYSPIRDDAGLIVKWCGVGTDVEESRRAEEVLRQRELDFQSIVDSIPVPVAVTAPSGEVEGLNRPTLDYFGKTVEELKGWKASDVVHPDDLEHTIAAQLAAHQAGHAYNVESRHRRADGVYRWHNVRGFPLRDPQGHILRWFHLLIDIDDRKQAEEARAESERNARLIVDSIPGLVAAFTPDGKLEFVNRQIRDYFGKAPEEMKRWAAGEMTHPEDLPRVVALFTKAIGSGEPFDFEVRARRFDGVYRWFQSRGYPLRDSNGRILRWYNLLADIDDRKQVEESLRRSEAFLAEGQRLSLTGNFSWRLNPDEILFSDQLCRIFGFEKGAPVTIDRIAARVHPDDEPLLAETIERARAGSGDLDYEMRLQMPDNEVRYLRTIARSVRHPDGRLEYLGAVQDVTERRHSEEGLGRLRSELAHVTRVTSLGAMTASIAHEVNQPLAGIITNASTSLRMLAADPPNIEGARETARRTIRDGNRAADVIARLRALFSRRSAVIEPVDLNEAAREVIALSWGDLHRSRVAFSTEFADGLPLVGGDRVQLQQVIMNLLRNAADAMREVDDRPRLVVIKTEADAGDHVRLSVRDAGSGFGPQGTEKLFEAFYTTKSDGMGIGLSISRSIIESHHGRLWATANDGPGATFSFTVPAYSHDGALAREAGRIDAPVAGNDQSSAGVS